MEMALSSFFYWDISMYKWVLCQKKPSQISIQKPISYRTNIIDFSLEIYEVNVAGIIPGKVQEFSFIATDGISLGWSLGSLLGMWEVFLLGILITVLGSLDGSLDGYNDVNLEVLLLGCSLGSSDCKLLVSGECIKLGSNYGKLIGNILAKCRYNHTWYLYWIRAGFLRWVLWWF